MANIDIGKRTKQVRESVSLNQRDFATRIGSSSGRVSEIESGKNLPSGDLLIRLNEEFGADITWLLTGKKDAALIPHGTVLTAEEQVLVDGFRALDAPTRKRLLAFVLGGEITPSEGKKKSIKVRATGGNAAGRDVINTNKGKA